VVGANEESNLECHKIILRCQSVCPQTSSKHEKRDMLRRSVLNWHPDKTGYMQRDSKVCQEVFAFLNELRERFSMLWFFRIICVCETALVWKKSLCFPSDR